MRSEGVYEFLRERTALYIAQVWLAVVPGHDRLTVVATMHTHLVGRHTIVLPATAHLVASARSTLTQVYLGLLEECVLARICLHHFWHSQATTRGPMYLVAHEELV